MSDVCLRVPRHPFSVPCLGGLHLTCLILYFCNLAVLYWHFYLPSKNIPKTYFTFCQILPKKRFKEVGLISWLIVSIQIRNDMTHCAHLPVTLTRQSAHPNIEADIFCWRVTSCGSTCSATDIDDVAGASISWLPIGMWLMGSDNLSKSKRSTTPWFAKVWKIISYNNSLGAIAVYTCD